MIYMIYTQQRNNAKKDAVLSNVQKHVLHNIIGRFNAHKK